MAIHGRCTAWPIGVVAAALTVVGCAANKPAPQPQPQPPEEMYPMLAETAEETSTIQAADLGVADSSFADVGAKTLEIEPTVGRFPTGLSVARVEAVSQDETRRRFLRIVSAPDYRTAYWGHAMRDLRGIREVTLLRTYGLDPRGADWQALLKSALELDCDLCLIYAQVDDTKADAEFIAVLWDAVTEKVLATFRVPIVLPPDARLKYEKKRKYVGLRSDAECRAESELRRLVRDTIWDLAARDGAISNTQPSPWQTDQPLIPRDLHRHLRIYTNDGLVR